MSNDTLRAALLNRDFDQVQNLIRDWGKSVTRALKEASGEPERRRVYEEALAIAENNIYLTRVIRAHIAAELEANSGSFLYRDSDLEHHRWNLQA